MHFRNLVCAVIVAFLSMSPGNAQDSGHNPFEPSKNRITNQNNSDENRNKPSAKKKIATSLPKSSNTQKSPAPNSAKRRAIARKKAIAKAKQKALAAAPFKNNHYVLTGYLPVNGFHKGKKVVVIVDKGSHFTHVLQLQGKKIYRVLTISNAIGTADTPTPPGPYLVAAKKRLPTWIPPKSIDKKQKPVPPYNLTHRNPLGVASIYLNKYEINLHGTNQQNLIRKSVSHGCVRHSNKDIMKLYYMVDRGDRVYIVNKFRGKVLHRSDFTNPR